MQRESCSRTIRPILLSALALIAVDPKAINASADSRIGRIVRLQDSRCMERTLASILRGVVVEVHTLCHFLVTFQNDSGRHTHLKTSSTQSPRHCRRGCLAATPKTAKPQTGQPQQLPSEPQDSQSRRTLLLPLRKQPPGTAKSQDYWPRTHCSSRPPPRGSSADCRCPVPPSNGTH